MCRSSMLGSTFGHYRVLERLGAGGMGEVFLVDDLKLHRRAALKLISSTLTLDETRRQRFLQEARLAASIDHPHIAAIHDIGDVEGRTYIAMEYVAGHSMRDLLRDGPIHLRRALDLAIQGGDALAKVHVHGVIHRDLKPENLLVTQDGYLKIIDFGLAKLVDPLAKAGLADAATIEGQVPTEHGVMLGTLGYMSPEQVRGAAVDARSDIFSFGAVLYEMATGKSPFKRESTAETISAILTETPPPATAVDASVSSELQRILRKCLAKDPEARYQGMRDLVVDLRALRESLPGSQSMSRSAPVASPSVPKRIGLAARAAVVAAAVLAVVGWWALRDRQDAATTTVDGAAARPVVAIVAFEVMSGGPDVAWLGKGLPSLLVTGLAQTPDVEVVGTERLAEAAKQLGAPLDSIERSRFGELSRRAGARFVVSGTIVQAGSDLRIDARVEDLITGSVRLAESVRGPDPLTLADDLSRRVRRGLNLQIAPDAVRRIADVSSASVEAHRAFTAGVEAQQNNRVSDARRLLEDAIRLDPQFGLAYFYLAEVARFHSQEGEARRLIAKAAELLDHMTERDALMVRSAVELDAGRADESRRILETLVARYPDSERAWLGLANPRNAAETEAIMARAVAALPLSAALHNSYGYALLRNQKLEEALREFDTYVKLRPSEANAVDSLGEGLLVSGNLTAALQRFDESMKGGFTGAFAGRIWTLAALGRYDELLAFFDASPRSRESYNRIFVLSRLGQYREARQFGGRVVDRAAKSEAHELAVGLQLTTAAFGLERGDCAAVARDVAAAERWLSRLRADQAPPWLIAGALLNGACDARDGRIDRARGHLAQATRSLDDGTLAERWWVRALEGEIALAERDYDRAARSFASGEPRRKMYFSRAGAGAPLSFLANNLVLRDGRARAAVAQGKLDEAIALYRGLLTPGPQQKWTAMLDPLHVLALARVLEKAGQRDAGRTEYQRFLDFWKGADKELPELAEARQSLARLASR
jgi:tetratricopeptide (TPR) repeat protein